MKTLIKIVVGLVVVVIVLVGAAIVIAPMVIDPNEYKDKLAESVREETGRELRIEGDIGLTFFPWIGIDMGKVALGNAPGFDAPVFASTDRVTVRVKLMPLLQSRVEMDTVVVHGLALNLERDARGRSNWEDLAGRKKHAERSGGQGSGAQGDSGGEIAGLAIGGLDVRDAQLSWSDRQSGQKAALENLALRSSAFVPGKPVDLQLGFDIATSNPPMRGRVEGKGRLAFDPGSQQASVSGLEIEAKLEGETLPGGKATVSLGADATFDGSTQSAALENLRLGALDLEVTGRVAATGLDKGGKLDGRLVIAEFNPRKLLQALGQAVPPTADGDALTRLSFETGLGGTPDSIALKPLAAKLDDTSLTGTLSVANFAKPAVRFDLALDRIDLDRYLPPPVEGGTPAPASPGAAASQAGALPLEPLRALDVDGAFTAGSVKVAKLTITDVTAKLKARDGVIALSPVSARLYEGTYAGDIGLDVRKDQPRLSLNERLTGIQAGPLLKDLQGEEPLTGKGDVAAKLTAVGAGPDAIKKTLNGSVRFVFADGAVKGVNIGRMIRDARARIQGKPAPGEEPARTDFAELSGTVVIKDGLATNNDLSLQSPLLRVGGAGQANLPTEAIDYTVKATVVATSKGQGGKGLEDLAGLTIPVKVSGTFSAPSYGLDVEALAGALVKSKAADLVKQQGGAVIEQITGTAGAAGGGTADGAKKVLEGAGGTLKKLFGN